MIPALFDHLWQSTVFAALAAALTVLFRRNGASVRYGLWFAASLKFLVPFSLLFALGSALAPRAATVSGSLPLVTLIEEVGSPLSHAAGSLDLAPAFPRGLPFPVALPEIAASLWGIGCLTVLILWLARWVRVRRLARDAKPLPISAAIPVKSSPASIEPGVIGVLRPVLVLPEGLAEHLSQEEFRAVLAHELCHVRRRDNLTAAVHMLVEALFWFFPLVWWIGARLILEREHACDESALAAGHDPGTYAESILKVCKFYLHSPLPCMAGVSGADLKHRMEAIMSARGIRRLGPLQRGLLALSASAALAAPLASGFLSSQAAFAAGGNPSDASAMAARQYEQAKPRSTVPYNPTDFDRYVGYYQLGPETFFHITRRGRHYMTQIDGQQPIEVYPDSAGEFFSKVVPAQITFDQTAAGRVTGLVLHQGGVLFTAKRVDAAVAEQGQAAVAARIRSNTPSPGTEAALRHQIAALVKSHAPDYSALSPALATAARQQTARASQMFSKLGALESLTFKGVSPQGFDIYDATFANGNLEFAVAPLGPDGKINGMAIGPPQH